jgi:hypothetical protein
MMSQDKKHMPIPVEIVFSPQWWYKHSGITFDRDFFFDPDKRVQQERKMEQVLYDKFGKYGMGSDKDRYIPQIGAVHLAAGFFVSQMLGCEVRYNQDAPPQVLPLEIDNISEFDCSKAFESEAWKNLEELAEALKQKYGFVKGDINWGGILNIALDLRGQQLFMDMFDKPDDVHIFFDKIYEVIDEFTRRIEAMTGTTSISVNRTVRHLKKPVFLHSECSHTMISVEDYEKFLMPYDIQWSLKKDAFGIHYCGSDPHRFAESFTKIPELFFLDVGWGGDIGLLRKYLPDTFLNIRLSPVELASKDNSYIEKSIRDSVEKSGNCDLTGICCINMDDTVDDGKVCTIFETVNSL